jgi:HK97 family phage major capsid protein
MQIQRTITIEQREASAEGLVDMAISSEAPYERWFGIEVLRHSAESVDLARLADGRHPLLLNHDTEKQIGVVARAWIDDEQKMLRGSVKFSRSALGQEIAQDVADGIRSLVSVGYMIDEIEEVEPVPGKAGEYTTKRVLTGDEFEREMRNQHGEHFLRSGVAAARAKGEEPPVFLVTRWQPFEASVVPVPADASVGIGRSSASPPPAASKPATPATPATPEIRIMENQQDNNARVAEILELGRQYSKFVKDADTIEAVRSGLTVDKFKDKIIAAMASSDNERAMHVGMSKREAQRYSFAKAARALITGDWSEAGFERECSRAMEKLTGQSAAGFIVPYEAMKRDFNVGTGSEAGNLVPTFLRDDLYVDVLRNNLVAARLGILILPGLTGNIDIPRKTVAGTLGMVSEIGSASETQPTTAKLTLSPKRISAYTEVSKQALIQSPMALDAMLRDDLLMGAAVALENQYLNGTGSNNITGLRYTSGIGTVAMGANGAAPTWQSVVDLESACANVNAEPDRLAGYVVNTRTRGRLKTTQLGTNLPFIWQGGQMALNEYRVAVTNTLPSNLTKGTSTTVCSLGFFASDWSMKVIGLFGAPDVTIDPYTKADTGQVKITLSQFADSGERLPAAFSHVADWLSN